MAQLPIKTNRTRRNQSFDLLRIFFALCVLLSHAPELTDGNRSRELLTRLTRSPVSFGVFAVDGFFLLSGYLIVRSWQHDPRLFDFLQKRVLRIVPGYLVAALVSTAVIGLAAPGAPFFFHHLGMKFVRSLVELHHPITPVVFPGDPYLSVNGALWTIAYEFRCYLLVAFFGLLGFFNRTTLMLVANVALLVGMALPDLTDRIPWSPHIEPFLGTPTYDFRLIATFFVGASFYLFAKRIPFRPHLACIALFLVCLTCVFLPRHFETALILGGGYLLFYGAQTKIALRIYLPQLPDVSYGVYLYGWPVECLLIWFLRSSPWVTFFCATLICLALGWVSWHFIERPMLTLKRKPTAGLAAP